MSDNRSYQQQPGGDLELHAGPPATLDPTSLDWRRALEVFLDSRADSPHTRRAYRRHVNAAMAELGVATLADLTGEQLAAWRARLLDRDCAPATNSQALAAVRSFLRFARAVGAHRLPDEVIRETLRTPPSTTLRPYQVLADWEITALLGACESDRDRALIAVLLGAGLRAAELVGLDVDDIGEDQDGEVALLVHGKGRKDRVVPLRRDVARIVRRYLASSGRALGDIGPLFLSGDRAQRRDDGRLSTRAIGYLLADLLDHAGVDGKRISPHSCRHTYAIRALRGGASTVTVQKLLGHSSPATTQRYLDHLETSELRSSVPDLPAA